MIELIFDTPIEKIELKGFPLYVKREDLSCSYPGPPFAKIRGLHKKLTELKKTGIQTVGYMETSLSMASWGIAYLSQKIGLKAVIFYPQYKEGYKYEQENQFKKWKEFNAEFFPIEHPGRQKINHYLAKQKLLSNFPNSIMLDQGLPFEETIEEVGKQVDLIPKELLGGSIVVSVGSGVMISGIINGLKRNLPKEQNMEIYGIVIFNQNLESKKRKIEKRSKTILKNWGFFSNKNINLTLLDLGYQYEQKEEIECPFPCSKYYDRKAWKWLNDNISTLKQPIIFWNIGGDFV